MALTIVVRGAATASPATPGPSPVAPPRITFDAPRIVIGRGDGCEVRLPDPSVSHRHASIRQRGTEYIVLDEGSTNGTFVGPVRLSPQAPRVLADGDLIRVGRVWLEVLLEQAPPTQNVPLATKEFALGLVAQALASHGESSAPKVKVIEGPHAGKELVLARFDHAYTIGRTSAADLSLEDPDLSRKHVELTRRGARLMIKDLGSKNGSRIDERPLAAGQETAWPAAASLWLGTNRLTFEDPVKEALEELERAADERVGEDEVTDAPLSPEAGDGGDRVERNDPVRAERAKVPAARRAPRARSGAGWNATDVLVAFVALAVLAMSIAGLVWLIGSSS